MGAIDQHADAVHFGDDRQAEPAKAFVVPFVAAVAHQVLLIVRHERVADGVFITYRDTKRGWVVMSVGQVAELPRYLETTLDADLQYLHVSEPRTHIHFPAAFTVNFDIDKVPPGRFKVVAWAYDFVHSAAWRIPGTFMADSEKHTVVPLNDNAADDDEPVK